jgi:tRNA modification GTPase
MIDCRFMLMTPPQPGAIAIVQLHGDVGRALASLTNRNDWPIGRPCLITVEGIDDAVMFRLSSDMAQVMPHGGIRVVQRIAARLIGLGMSATNPVEIDPMQVYPEAPDRFHAIMLEALSRAASPLAIDLLLDQPRRWLEFVESGAALSIDDVARSRRLSRLIVPPRVVVAGAANVGKSTLANALLGRAMSIALDEPGTTRDYTVGRIELAGLVVDWYDTPGIRQTDDPIERTAIELARHLIESCDLLIAMSDHEHHWPDLPREPDLRLINKIDLQRDVTRFSQPDAGTSMVLRISATTGEGLAELVRTVRDALVFPEDLSHCGPWLFDERLRAT